MEHWSGDGPKIQWGKAAGTVAMRIDHGCIHIFVADKGDYYDIADGLPQNQQ